MLLDASLRPWLLEVNTGPNLAAPTPLDTHIKGRVAAEMLHLAGVVPPQPRRKRGGGGGAGAAAAAAPAAALMDGPPAGSAAACAAAAADAAAARAGLAPLRDQPHAVRAMVAEEGRRGAFQRVFPSPDPAVNAQLLPLLRPRSADADAMCAWVAAQAAAGNA